VSALDLTTASGSLAALATVDAAINTVNSTRAELGAYLARFSSVVASLATTAENTTASRSRIQDADFAMETANLSRAQILQQAGTAMVAQANQLPQGVMALLRH
jgi:flagellin